MEGLLNGLPLQRGRSFIFSKENSYLSLNNMSKCGKVTLDTDFVLTIKSMKVEVKITLRIPS